MNDLDKQITQAQEALNDLVQTKQALETLEKIDQTTMLMIVLDQLGLLKALGVVPVLVLYRDGTAAIVRHDDIRSVEPIKSFKLKGGNSQ